MPTPPSYHSYLLRLWQVKTDGEGWRVRVTQVDSGEERLFTDLDTLFTFLRETAQSNPETGPTSPNDFLPHELAWTQRSKPMWIHKTTVRLDPSNKDKLIEMLATEEVFDLLRAQKGFRAIYMVENLADPQEMASFMLWENREGGETFFASPAYREILVGAVPLLVAKPVNEAFNVKAEMEMFVPAMN